MIDGKANEFDREAEGQSGEGNDVEGQYAEAVPVPPPTQEGGNDYGATATNDYDQGTEEHHEKITQEAVQDFVKQNGSHYLLMFVASWVLLVSASVFCTDFNGCTAGFGWGVAAGVLGVVVSGLLLFLERKGEVEAKQKLGVTIFLFLIGCSCVVLTFTTFKVPGNAYFACWGLFIASLLALVQHVAKARQAVESFKGLGATFAILLAGSLIVLFSSMSIGCNNGCSGTAGYGIAVGCVSFVVGVVFLALQRKQKLSPKAAKGIGAFLLLWWLVAFFVLTFGLFQYVSNGYFSTVACLIAAAMLVNTTN